MKKKKPTKRKTVSAFVNGLNEYLRYSFLFPSNKMNNRLQDKSEPSRFLLAVFKINREKYVLRFDKSDGELEIVNINSSEEFVRLKFKGKNSIKRADNWKNVKISKLSERFILTYTVIGERKNKHNCWISEDLINWQRYKPLEKLGSLSAVPNYSHDGEEIAYRGDGKKIYYYRVSDMAINKERRETDLQTFPGRFNEKRISLANAFYLKGGVLVFYYGFDNRNDLGIGAALMNIDNPSQVIWETQETLWRSPDYINRYRPLGIIKDGEEYEFYCSDKQENLYVSKLPKILMEQEFSEQKSEESPKEEDYLYLSRSFRNPIITPDQQSYWETNGTFNPAAVEIDGRTHLVYRAVGIDGMSVLGYAASRNGYEISEKSSDPAYLPSADFEFLKTKQKAFQFPYMSGGGWGGCEDPRLSRVGNKIFMTYTAFNGRQAPGVALTSIKVKDFVNKNWCWSKPKLISQPGVIQKNWVVFPGKINGKYAILHSISPNILIDYFDSLEEGNFTITSSHSRETGGIGWERTMRGVGAPPIKTEKGWLTFYHAMDSQYPDRYKLGVMLLDLENPEKMVSKYHRPILEPDEVYENDGKPGVIYVCGAVIKKNKIFVYYGGADKVTCVATISLSKMMNSLLNYPQKISFEKIFNQKEKVNN